MTDRTLFTVPASIGEDEADVLGMPVSFYERAVRFGRQLAAAQGSAGFFHQQASGWIAVSERLPELRVGYRKPIPYVLAVDALGRMSVAYCDSHSSGYLWVMAKAIGDVTHWMPLPTAPANASGKLREGE